MASVKDTATFFAEGTASQFEHVIKLYPQALRLKADLKTKKPEELIKLDNWYQNELPKKIKSRGKDAHLIHEELVQTMKWKQTRGKFYPQLSYLVKVNTPRAVMAETKKAFKKLPNLEQAITALSNLKGVGTTMASALLAAASPENAPFMADECLMAIPEIEGIDYTTKEYLNFVQHIQTTVERLNKQISNGKSWSPHRVELALWTHYVASELQPELLDGIPGTTENGNSHPTNGETTEPSDDSNQEEEVVAGGVVAVSNGNKDPIDPAAIDENSTTSFTEDSLDKPATLTATIAAAEAATMTATTTTTTVTKETEMETESDATTTTTKTTTTTTTTTTTVTPSEDTNDSVATNDDSNNRPTDSEDTEDSQDNTQEPPSKKSKK
ncbi:cell wall integrity and stress response component 4 [Neodiprion virginianus]|uniref:cell wall integrity and stress response component 4 n=1 Tax=Neodiprion virginianus TaxID=2961670 RepID=UPI001ED94B1B|nr:cell wall integrity and stress response component 4 isoform X1 [Neodiprion fabricii]XP_046627981.1 cell wall integrity and stress response component 4 [Neodiprion virginianus]